MREWIREGEKRGERKKDRGIIGISFFLTMEKDRFYQTVHQNIFSFTDKAAFRAKANRS